MKGIGPPIVNSQSNTYIHNPYKREPKKMLNTINTSIKQHIKATLKLIIPKNTHYIDEVMLHRVGIMVGIYVWPGVNMKGSHATKLDISSNGLAKGKNM